MGQICKKRAHQAYNRYRHSKFRARNNGDKPHIEKMEKVNTFKEKIGLIENNEKNII